MDRREKFLKPKKFRRPNLAGDNYSLDSMIREVNTVQIKRFLHYIAVLSVFRFSIFYLWISSYSLPCVSYVLPVWFFFKLRVISSGLSFPGILGLGSSEIFASYSPNHRWIPKLGESFILFSVWTARWKRREEDRNLSTWSPDCPSITGPPSCLATR